MTTNNADPSETGYSLVAAAPAIARLHGVTAVHVGQHMPHITNLETAETRLRSTAIVTEFDFVLLIEGIRISSLENAISELPDMMRLQSQDAPETDIYHLIYLLDDER